MSRRNQPAAKARRRAERAERKQHDPYLGCRHVRDGDDLSRCRWPDGCLNRWTLDIVREPDGWSAFLCAGHGWPWVQELNAAGQLRSVSEWPGAGFST